MAQEHRIALGEIPPEGATRLVEAGGRRLLLVMGASGPALVDPVCPHAGAPLADGRVTGDRIRCSRHGYAFDLATGACARAAREGFEALRVYPARIEGGDLLATI